MRVGNIMVNGEPVIEFNAKGVRDDLKMKSSKALQNYEQDEN